MQIGSPPDSITPDEILTTPEAPPEEITLADVAQEASETLTFQDIAYEEAEGHDANEEVPTEAGEPDGLYSDLEEGEQEDGGAAAAEAELEAQKGGEEEVVSNRANTRIQSLVTERNAAQEQMAQMQQQMAQMQQQQFQLEQTRNQREEQRYQAEDARRASAQKAATEAELSEFEQYELKQQRGFDGQLQQMEERLRNEFAQKEQARQQQLQQSYAEAEKKRRFSSVDTQANAAATEFLKDYAPEDQAELMELTKTQILVHGAAFGLQPAEAAKSLQTYLQGYQKADHRRRLAKHQAQPKAAPRGRVTRPATQQVPVAQETDFTGMNDEDMLARIMSRYK